jgi:hypothetical protein
MGGTIARRPRVVQNTKLKSSLPRRTFALLPAQDSVMFCCTGSSLLTTTTVSQVPMNTMAVAKIA